MRQITHDQFTTGKCIISSVWTLEMSWKDPRHPILNCLWKKLYYYQSHSWTSPLILMSNVAAKIQSSQPPPPPFNYKKTWPNCLFSIYVLWSLHTSISKKLFIFRISLRYDAVFRIFLCWFLWLLIWLKLLCYFHPYPCFFRHQHFDHQAVCQYDWLSETSSAPRLVSTSYASEMSYCNSQPEFGCVKWIMFFYV